jgi:hypothetical protein
MHAGPGVECERELREEPGLSSRPDVMGCEQVPSPVFPDEPGCSTGEPAPTERHGRFDVPAREGRERLPERRRSGRRTVDDERREPVEEQVDGARID